MRPITKHSKFMVKVLTALKNGKHKNTAWDINKKIFKNEINQTNIYHLFILFFSEISKKINLYMIHQ